MDYLPTLAVAVALAAAVTACSAAEPIRVVAAESVYGDVAAQLGGSLVSVTSILANPDQDPHLFEASPSVARAVAAAQVVVRNGIDYDPWMDGLLSADQPAGRRVFSVAALGGRKTGDNPHVAYDPGAVLALAKALSAAFAALDPGHRDAYANRLAAFEASMVPVQSRIASLRSRLLGQDVTATEPVFGYMIAALGMISRNPRFQLAVMNGTEPSASDVAAFEDDLRAHRVRFLVYNRQAKDAVADRMKAIAEAAGVPVVGAAETEPRGGTYAAWMLGELDLVDRATGL